NGLPNLGRAVFAANTKVSTPGRKLEEDVADFVRSQLEAQSQSGQLSDLEVEPAQPTQLDGRDALLLRARYQDEGVFNRVRAYFVPRGALVYELAFRLPEAYPDYERVAEEMLSTVRLDEPADLREARGRALLAPGSFAALSGLGDALGQLGE